MNTTMKTTIASLTLLCFISLSAQQVENIRIRSVSKTIIKGELNGKKAFFLVDTGSDLSFINSGQLYKFQLKEKEIYGNSKEAIGFNGETAAIKKVANANLIIGENFAHSSFYSINLNELTKSIEAKTNIKISGIIGADILKKYNCVIDYNQRQVTFLNARSKKRVANN